MEDALGILGEHIETHLAVVLATIDRYFAKRVSESRENFREVHGAVSDGLGAFGRVPIELHA
jgi:hypothetical protein